MDKDAKHDRALARDWHLSADLVRVAITQYRSARNGHMTGSKDGSDRTYGRHCRATLAWRMHRFACGNLTQAFRETDGGQPVSAVAGRGTMRAVRYPQVQYSTNRESTIMKLTKFIAITSAVLLGSITLAYAGSNTSQQEQIDQLKHKVQVLQQQMQAVKQSKSTQPSAEATTAANEATLDKLKDAVLGKASYPIEILPQPLDTHGVTLWGGLETTTQFNSHFVPAAGATRTGTESRLNNFILGTSGRYGDLSFQFQYWFLRGSDTNFLKYAWVNYQFGENSPHSLTAGYFQAPFGNAGYGYFSYFGSMGYLLGFADAQAGGLGYTYNEGPWRLDLDFFKNNTLSQDSTYSGKVTQTLGYRQQNSGNARLAYTFNQGARNSVEVSVAAQGGQLAVGTAGTHGSRWAATVAFNASLGPWIVLGQYVDYRYNIPSGQTDASGSLLPTNAVGYELRGLPFMGPAHAQLFGLSLARIFDVDWGPISNVMPYVDYAYLDVSGNYQTSLPGVTPTYTDDDGQYALAGVVFSNPHVRVWLTAAASRNAAMTSLGPNDSDWHYTGLLTANFYFGGRLLN